MNYRIFHKNINLVKFPSPQVFETIMFDSNLNCNLRCVYCHNHRDNGKVDEDDFKKFLDTQVYSVQNFQIGCAMEPTLDKRMVKFANMVGKSHAKPLKNFRIQTNGILLHLHDLEALKKAGINLFTISLDSVDPDIHSELRGGSDLSKILKNIEWLKKSWEGVNIVLVTTVTTKNISGLKNLSQYALDNGINNIELRNMFHHPESKIVNHSKMHKLIVENQDFKNSCEKLVAKYGKKITFHINDAVRLSDEKKTTKA